jgi:iron complex outermembrane receptor protein
LHRFFWGGLYEIKTTRQQGETMLKLRPGILSAVPGLLALTSVSLAAEQSMVLEEVLVTAQFRSERLQETPIAITAVTADMLQQRSQTSVQEVAAQAPNVTLTRSSAAFGPSVTASIRGVGQYDFNPAYEPGVGMYVDDVYYGSIAGTIFDLLDLERVEILRGPQGTLAGKNSIGGAVKLFSKRPTGDGSGFIEASYGSYNRVDVRGSGDFALIDDKLLMRVSGVTKQRDGFVSILDYGCKFPNSGVPLRNNTANCKIGEQSGIDYSGARASLLWIASDKVDVNIIADYTHDTSSPPGSVLVYANNPSAHVSQFPGVVYDSRFVPTGKAYYNYASFSIPDGVHTGGLFGDVPVQALNLSNSSDFQGWGVSAQINWTVSDSLSFTSITAHREFEAAWNTDGDLSPLQLALGADRLEHRQFSQEFRLNGTAGAVDYTVGLYYYDQKTVYPSHQLLVYPPVYPLDFLQNDPVNADTQAAFAHAVWHVNDKLNLTAGVRYTEESKDYTFSRLNRDGTPNPFLGNLHGLSREYEGSKTDFRVSVDYKWTPDLMTYAQVATGFKGGGIGPRPFNPDQARPFNPEELTAYEVGIKSTLAGGALRLNAAAFYNDYTDIQLTLLSCPQFGGPGPCALPQNAGDAEVKGVELEMEGRFGGFGFDLSASYLDFEYTWIHPQAGGAAQPNGVQIGMITPFTPEVKASAGLQYEFGLGGGGSLTPRIDVTYQDEMYTNAVNKPTNYVDSRTLANARLTWRAPSGETSVAAEVTNLANKYYYVSKFDLVGAGAGYSTAVLGAPRMWAVTVRHNF